MFACVCVCVCSPKLIRFIIDRSLHTLHICRKKGRKKEKLCCPRTYESPGMYVSCVIFCNEKKNNGWRREGKGI